MKQTFTRSIPTTAQQDLFRTPSNQSAGKSISVYRVCLVKDATVSFGQCLRQQFPSGTRSDPEPYSYPRAARSGTVRRRSAKRQEQNNRTEHRFRGGSVIYAGQSQGSAQTRHTG